MTLNLDQAQSLLKMTDALEDLDDVQHVYTNADIPQDIMEQMQ